MFTDEANFFPTIIVEDVCGGKKTVKDGCAQKRDMLYGASLLVMVGSPIIILLTCTPSLKDIWGSGQIVPRTNSTPSFLHMRTNSTPLICTGGQTVPRRFAHADIQYPIDLHMRTNSTPSFCTGGQIVPRP